MDNLDSQHIRDDIQSMDFHNNLFCIRKLKHHLVHDILYSGRIVWNRNHLEWLVVVQLVVNNVQMDFRRVLLDTNKLGYDLQPYTMHFGHKLQYMDPSIADSNKLY